MVEVWPEPVWRDDMEQHMEYKISDEEEAMFEESWRKLQQGLDRLYGHVEMEGRSPFVGKYGEYMSLYSTVYDLCTAGRMHEPVEQQVMKNPVAIKLYHRYKEQLKRYLNRTRQADCLPGDDFLNRIVRRWKNYTVVTRFMQRLFEYLDRHYVSHEEEEASLRQCGLACFKNEMYEEVKHRLFDAVMDRVEAERRGSPTDCSMVADAVRLFVEMGTGADDMIAYISDFETPFLRRTAEFYRAEAAKLVAESSATVYLQHAEERLNQEQTRARKYLNPSSEPKLIEAVEVELLTTHQKTLIEMECSGVIALLRDLKLDELKRMFKLFNRIPKGPEPIAVILKDYLTVEGMHVVKKHTEVDELDFKGYVEDLMAIHDKYSKILNDVLSKHPVFQKAIRDSFEHFINQGLNTKTGQRHSAELLSNYCDVLMRSTGDKLSDDAVDEKLGKVVELFCYINDKDKFQEFYRQQLAKRLLMTTTSNNDAYERSLISKLKVKCGAPFTSKLEGMLNDRNISNENQREFRDYLRDERRTPGFEYVVQVLTTGFWPVYKVDPLNCPPEIEQMTDVFKEFYSKKTQSRVLKWVHSLASATLMANFSRSVHELSMTAYQACVCMTFNAASSHSVTDITAETLLPIDEVKKCLHSLSSSKYKILCRSDTSGGKETKDGDVYYFNEAFTEKSRKIKIPNVVLKSSAKVAAQISQQVEEDRRHAIDACVVRLMKSRKRMEHQQLVTEAIQQLRHHFKPDPKLIKRRVEDLITREYLERDPEQPSLYRYLA